MRKALAEVAEQQPSPASVNLEELFDRTRTQHEALEPERVAAARRVLGNSLPPADAEAYELRQVELTARRQTRASTTLPTAAGSVACRHITGGFDGTRCEASDNRPGDSRRAKGTRPCGSDEPGMI